LQSGKKNPKRSFLPFFSLKKRKGNPGKDREKRKPLILGDDIAIIFER
jgi:hypothetical protein